MKACGPSLRGQTVLDHYFVRRLIPANVVRLRTNLLQGIDEIKSKPGEQAEIGVKECTWEAVPSSDNSGNSM